DRGVRRMRCARVRGRLVADEVRGTGEGLRGNGLRHAGDPRRPAAGEGEVVLPAHTAAWLVDAARHKRVGEALRAGHVGCGDVRVERAEVGERVELEAATGEVAVDEAVRVSD